MQEKEVFLKRMWVVGLLASLCCLLWGSAFPSVKIGYRLFGIAAEDAWSQILFAGCRFSLAGVLTILIGSACSRKWLFPKKTSWGMIGKLCLLQTVFQYVFFYIGMAHTTGVKGSIINGSNTFLAVLTAGLVFRYEQLTARKLLGCLIGFAGVVVVNLDPAGLGGGIRLDGEGFILLASLAYALSSVFLKRYSVRENPVVLSGCQFLLGGLIMMAAALALGGSLHPSGPAAFLLLGYMACISAVAYSIWGILLKYNPVSRVTVFGLMNPLFGAILSALILDEGGSLPLWQTGAALALVCCGIYLVNRNTK